MPDQSDPSMDALLKAYAEKRRKDAEPDLEIHPATRSLIQSEVARQKGLARAKPSTFLAFMIALWPRLGLALGLCALLGTLVWYLGLPDRQPGQLAKNSNLPPTEPNQLARDESQPSPSAGKRDASEAFSQNRVGYAQTQTNAIPLLAGRFVRSSAFDEKDKTVDGLNGLREEQTRATVRQSLPAAKEFRSAAPNLNTASVLASFNVEQADNRLKLTDADGSTYEGPFWLDPSAVAPSSPAALEALKLESNPNRGLDVLSRTELAAPSSVAISNAPALILFQVGGTNLTTRQYLTFQGSFTLSSPPPASPATGSVRFRSAVPALSPAQAPAPLSAPAVTSAPAAATADRSLSQPQPTSAPRRLIQGKARLGNSIEWEIQAVPQ